ncbi:hypothetical protein [Pseudomonas frederiksbergensis]|uniref:hypothetical protein n=1 Tax=Pseudomonas frederiksbergensis TaxID=104087 RepID=UPI0011CE5671|nr:hypothetical protein [Pseudomonas frederiksbergensis]
MNKLQHDVLKYIYQRNEVRLYDLTEKMARPYKDHRDFYPIAGLVLEGFVGFTGSVPKPNENSNDLRHQDAYYLSRIFQCHSQGMGKQEYQEIHLINASNNSCLFIAAKGLLYFHEYYERRREWWSVAALGLASAIVAGCVAGILATNK